MEILDVIIEDGDELLIFTENPEQDIILIQNCYKNGDYSINLGYEIPVLSSFTFMKKEYPCIRLWFDREDDSAKGSKNKFKSLINKTNG